jgi:hypothetical protein
MEKRLIISKFQRPPRPSPIIDGIITCILGRGEKTFAIFTQSCIKKSHHGDEYEATK